MPRLSSEAEKSKSLPISHEVPMPLVLDTEKAPESEKNLKELSDMSFVLKALHDANSGFMLNPLIKLIAECTTSSFGTRL